MLQRASIGGQRDEYPHAKRASDVWEPGITRRTAMIVFVTTAEHDYTLRTFLDRQPSPLDGGVILMSYPELLSWRHVPKGTYILADLDRLDSVTRARVAERWGVIQEVSPGVRCLNDPRRFLDRWQLAEALHRQGRSPQKARRLDGDLSDLRYPAFIRHQDGHEGPLSEPLSGEAELWNRARAIVDSGGARLDQLWAVEYVDVRGEGGLFQKYSSFRIGESIFAHDLSMSRNWVCKGEDDAEDGADQIRTDRAFQVGNPHRELLRPVFDAAGVEYGRIDYAIHHGELVVFEINSNPYISPVDIGNPIWDDCMQHILRQYTLGMAALGIERESPYYLDLGTNDAEERIVASTRLRGLIRRALKATRTLHYEPHISRMRALLRGATHRGATHRNHATQSLR